MATTPRVPLAFFLNKVHYLRPLDLANKQSRGHRHSASITSSYSTQSVLTDLSAQQCLQEVADEL